MEHIFYFFTFFALMHETNKFVNPKNFQKKMDDLRTKSETNEEYTFEDAFRVFGILGYVLWSFIGLLTSQWIVFASMFLIGFLTIPWGKSPPTYIRKFDAGISILALFFIIINKYHLHIDLLQTVIGFFN